ncbi:polysaccharide deacetylase family protein [Glycomyces albidus]|uniref:Polysaccharide deacetylase family protein n=1 Tax=Glycomyces albidus TaxID=2656774 RepID=A0A6L5G1T9_9ACTN|nr:polysaccharide deacetylase family protein [Glycomyces albidus]MQM24136.1 polysaccharide deacetylase family protein [Glycomyces albidus]
MLNRHKSILTAIMGFVLGAALTVTLPAGPAYARPCKGYVGLTYDDGPESTTTLHLIDALTENDLRATFFNTGRNSAAHPNLVRAQRNAGMWIGNHSYSHPHMTELSRREMASEIRRAQRAIRKATGTAPELFRPPWGETNAKLRAVAAEFGLTEVLWDVDSRDWAGASTDAIVRAARKLRDGDIIVMHEDDWDTIDAVPRIARDLRSRGLCSGMISTSTGNAVAPD